MERAASDARPAQSITREHNLNSVSRLLLGLGFYEIAIDELFHDATFINQPHAKSIKIPLITPPDMVKVPAILTVGQPLTRSTLG